MAFRMNFSVNISDEDLDYENVGKDGPIKDSFRFLTESEVSVQRCPETTEIEVFRECSDKTSTSSSEVREEISCLQRHSWSSATQKVLSSMPSRKAGPQGSVGISKRARQSPDPQRCLNSPRTSRVNQETELVQSSAEGSDEGFQEQLVSNLRDLSVRDGLKKLQAAPLCLADKKKIRQIAFSSVAESSLISRNIPCCSRPCVCISKTWRDFAFSSLPLLSSLKLWHSALKKLSGRYGTGVLSYFLFLRTLLFMNLLLFIITSLFLVIPQAIYPPPSDASHPDPLSGLDLLTGTGYISQSLMFYGYYSNTTVKPCQDVGLEAGGFQKSCNSNKSPPAAYSISAAYFFTIAISFFVICIILVYRLSKSFGKSFHILKSNMNLSEKVFCSWDFKVSKKSSVSFQSEKISLQLKEQLSELTRGEQVKTCTQRFCSFLIQVTTWLLCLASIFFSVMGVCFVSEVRMLEPLSEIFSLPQNITEQVPENVLILPAVVSGFNLLLPGVFNLCAWLENYNSPSTRVYVSIFRNLLLKISIVGLLCYRWLGKTADVQCWENLVGQELYRLLLMDFIFTVLHTFLGEFLWRLFSKKMLNRNRKPVFDIARNVLELIYGQTLTWLGVLFAPLLPAVQIVKLFVLFYTRKGSLMLNCQASKKPWRATHMTTLFITLLWFPSFLGAAVTVVYTVWMIKPSATCGPFRNLTRIFESGSQWAEEQKNSHPTLAWLSSAYNILIDNPLLLFLPTGILLLVIYFHTQVVDGQKKIISRLEKQIENEGKDKKFLITQLQHLHEQD